MMRRKDCIAEFVRRRTDEIVVAVYSVAMDLLTLQPHPLNYYAVGAMGLASSHGLGLALGRPERRVIVLDGDGSILMNLGSLVSTAEAAPPNFVHIVLENGVYDANGGFPIPGRGNCDLVEMARAAGYKKARRYAELHEFRDALDGLLHEEGPIFVCLKVEPEEQAFIDYKTMYARETRLAFCEAVQARQAPER